MEQIEEKNIIVIAPSKFNNIIEKKPELKYYLLPITGIIIGSNQEYYFKNEVSKILLINALIEAFH